MNTTLRHSTQGTSISQKNNSMLFIGAMFYLFTNLVESPIRFALDAVGGVALIYLRDAVLILMLGAVLGAGFLKGNINRSLFFTLVLLAFFTMVAAVYVANALQILFSLKIILPFLAGLILYQELFSDKRRLTKYMWFFFGIVISGVYINVFFAFPWAGTVNKIGGVEIIGSLNQNTIGLNRITGFARTNFEAASHAILLTVYLAIFARGKVISFILWSAAGCAIVLTITKGIVVVYAILSLFFVANAIAPRLHKLYKWLLIVPIGVMVLFPLLMSELEIDKSDNVQVLLYASFADRIVNGWAPVFENVWTNGNMFVGRGVGGTGAGEFYFASDKYGSADNMFVYLYAWFGLFSLVLLVLLFWKSQKLNILSRRDDLCVFLWLVSIMTYGISSVIIESAFFAFFFGLCVARISRLEGEKRLFESSHLGCMQKELHDHD